MFPAFDLGGHPDQERRIARISCPAWLVTEPDGVERYREQTDEMTAAVRAERAKEDAALNALLESETSGA